ncbi:lipopolysaccharide biosynthesis protein [Solwaraspora sp. WMMB335]|uniref:lipopolysaccharide biosynthesis protein n=1 Tax=Solwaraspora sp. WMMB335 TaxID=3404118 RepID=UPI003B9599A1
MSDHLSTSDQPQRTVTLPELLRIPLLRWPVVVAGAAVGLLLAIGFLLVAPPAATATAVVAVRPVVTDAFTYPGAGADRSINMNVESGIATSTDVLSRIAQERGTDLVTVRRALEIEVPAGGQILRFTYAADTVDAAVATVNLAASTYLAVREQMYEQQRADMLASYDGSIAKVAEQQADVQRRVAEADTDGVAADAALAEFGSLSNQLTELNSARTEIAAIDVTPGWVTQRAQQQLTTAGQSRILYLAAGLLAGALLGVVFSYLRESTDRRVRSETDARDATGMPLLGMVRRRGPRVDARTVDADARYVAMAIAEQLRQEPRTPVVVIAARRREDITPMTASLAVALAADGRDVYVGDDNHRLRALRDALLADRRRVPSVPFVPAQPSVGRTGAGNTGDPDIGDPDTGDRGADDRGGDPDDTMVMSVAGGDDRTVILPRVTDLTDAPAGGSGGTRRPSPRPKPGATATALQSGPDGGPAADRRSDGDSRVPNGDSRAFDGAERGVIGTVAVRTLPLDALTVGTGMVRIGPYAQAPADGSIVLFNAPPAESDERGVREARSGTAIVVVERDRTRLADLRRLADRIRAAGADPLGFVLTGSGRG